MHRWEDHDDLAYVRANEPDPLRLDYLSATWSIHRLSNGVLALGYVIAKRFRDRLAKLHRQ
jgi:hypothetical protein